MRPITNKLVAILIGFIFYSMTLAVALPTPKTTSTLDIKQTTDPSNTTISHLGVRDTLEKCPTNDHGDKACGTCITLFEGPFNTGKSHISCTSPHQCVSASSLGLAEFRSIRFKGSTNCRFSQRQDCADNALGEDVIENSEMMEDLHDLLRHKLHSVECVRPN